MLKKGAYRRASVVIVTFDNLVFNRLCLESVLASTEGPNFEVVVVDNGSTDGTREYLGNLAALQPNVRLVLNERNLGFAPACNLGLGEARGDVLVLLNNDTLVARGWLKRLVRHLEDPTIGMVGPVTNRTGNEAQVDAPYKTYGGFVRFAADYSDAHPRRIFDIPTLNMFCAAISRRVFEHIGSLDEAFEQCMFEDDDYSMRVRRAGYRVVCAEDVFVHHFGQASVGRLALTGEYGKLFQANRMRFEEKWGVAWEPHRRRTTEQYQQSVDRIKEIVRTVLPRDATIAVVSKGDEKLLSLNDKPGWHFPQTEDGTYAGHHPADSAAAIAHLEALRSRGADFILFPKIAFWWLDSYVEFRKHLDSRYQLVVRKKNTCLVYALRQPAMDA